MKIGRRERGKGEERGLVRGFFRDLFLPFFKDSIFAENSLVYILCLFLIFSSELVSLYLPYKGRLL